MYSIVEGIPKPANMPEKRPGSKYPLAEMKVGSSFVVPYSEMNGGETPEKFRNRIYQSARNYALRDFNSRPAESKDDAKKTFTAVVMDKDDDQNPMRWAAGDVVVWRDQ